MTDLFEEFLIRRDRLQTAGYHFHFIWECQWNIELRDERVRTMVSGFAIMDPLEPRNGNYFFFNL